MGRGRQRLPASTATADRGIRDGAHPSLEDLDDGDLKHAIDFRQVYASLLGTWLGCPVSPVIGTGFVPLDLFKKS